MGWYLPAYRVGEPHCSPSCPTERRTTPTVRSRPVRPHARHGRTRASRLRLPREEWLEHSQPTEVDRPPVWWSGRCLAPGTGELRGISGIESLVTLPAVYGQSNRSVGRLLHSIGSEKPQARGGDMTDKVGLDSTPVEVQL